MPNIIKKQFTGNRLKSKFEKNNHLFTYQSMYRQIVLFENRIKLFVKRDKTGNKIMI